MRCATCSVFETKAPDMIRIGVWSLTRALHSNPVDACAFQHQSVDSLSASILVMGSILNLEGIRVEYMTHGLLVHFASQLRSLSVLSSVSMDSVTSWWQVLGAVSSDCSGSSYSDVLL